MPKAKKIAEYILDSYKYNKANYAKSTDNNYAKYTKNKSIDAEYIHRVLTKYQAVSLLPLVLKYMKSIYKERYPTPTLEAAFSLDDETVSWIKNKYNISDIKLIVNKNLLGGYTLIRDYKMIDNSLLGTVDKLFK